MRVNIYSEELTNDIQVVSNTTRDGNRFLGVRFILESTDKLHNTPDDDDRSAVTFWFKDRYSTKEFFEQALYEISHSWDQVDKNAP